MKKAIKRRGLTQQRFAELMYCEERTVQNWCNKSCPASGSEIDEIAHILGINSGYLTGETNDPDPYYLLETDYAEHNLLSYISSGRTIQFAVTVLITGEDIIIPSESLLCDRAAFSFSEPFAFAVLNGERKACHIKYAIIQNEENYVELGYGDFASLMYQIEAQLELMLTPSRIYQMIKIRQNMPLNLGYMPSIYQSKYSSIYQTEEKKDNERL